MTPTSSNDNVECFETSIGHEMVQVTVNAGSKEWSQTKNSAICMPDTEFC